MIKTIVFDLGGVYFDEMPFYEYAAEKFGVDKQETKELLKKEYYANASDSKKAGEFWQKFKEKNGIDKSAEEIKWEFIISRKPKEKVVKLIRTLRKKYNILYLSNSNADLHSGLQQVYDFMQDFDGGILSHEKSYWKPDERIYQDIIVMAQCKPEDMIFVDDVDSNLTTARQLGMKTLLFQDENKILEELQKLGVIIS